MASQIVFGHMHEDHSVELRMAQGGMHAIVVVSGGDLALALAARGVDVLAVDTNPAQIALVEEKIRLSKLAESKLVSRWFVEDAGDAPISPNFLPGSNVRHGLCFSGRVDSKLRLMGPIVRWFFDWPRREKIRSRHFLVQMMWTFARLCVRFVHGAKASRSLGKDVFEKMESRLRTAVRSDRAHENHLVQVLLGHGFGSFVPDVWSPAGIRAWGAHVDRVRLGVADLLATLIDADSDSVQLISASNVVDILSEERWDELCRQAGRVLARGGRIVVRSMVKAECVNPCPDILETERVDYEDSSPLCPVIWIGRRK